MSTPSSSNSNEPDLLDRVIRFLSKREGIDKTLKLIRYGSRLLGALSKSNPDLHKRFASLDSSLGTTRKAFRLGKFLQDVNSFRKSRSTGPTYLLETLAYGGEGIYFFIEQAVWLIKAGALDKTHQEQLVLLSAWAEFIGYIGSITLSAIKLRELGAKEAAIVARMEKKRKEEGVLDFALDKQVAALRALKALRILAIVQDVADAGIAINDIGGGLPVLNNPITLALAGLISGSISFQKNWTAT